MKIPIAITFSHITTHYTLFYYCLHHRKFQKGNETKGYQTMYFVYIPFPDSMLDICIIYLCHKLTYHLKGISNSGHLKLKLRNINVFFMISNFTVYWFLFSCQNVRHYSIIHMSLLWNIWYDVKILIWITKVLKDFSTLIQQKINCIYQMCIQTYACRHCFSPPKE